MKKFFPCNLSVSGVIKKNIVFSENALTFREYCEILLALSVGYPTRI